MGIQRRTDLSFTPTQHSTAEDKMQFYTHFIRFVKSGYKHTLFHKWFYRRLSMTFGHIAHYNVHGFYEQWFSTEAKQKSFLERVAYWGCYGDPAYTYSDVELALRDWVRDSNLIPDIMTKAKADAAARTVLGGWL